MSRTIRRKNQTHLLNYSYTRAFGYYNDHGWVEGKYGPYMDYIQASKDVVIKINYNLYGDRKRYDSIGTRMTADNRKLDEHKFRTKEKGKITRFLKGIDDDVFAEDIPKFAIRWW